MSAMSQLLLRSVVLFASLAALLPAQEPEKPKEPPKAEAKPQQPAPVLDDATTANDKAIMAIDAFIAGKKIEKAGRWREQLSQPPKQSFDPDCDYFWHLETEVGTLKIRFFGDTAPIHVTSGIYLARLGFFDGIGFHRIIPGFMAQGGDPTGSGSGGPGYKFGGEFDGKRRHDKPGILSMAHAGPGTDGSQFFITFGPTPHLDNKHTIWGEVVDGLPQLKALEGKGSQQNNGMLRTPVRIERSWVSVAKKGKAAEPAKDAPKPGDGK
jgi:peptidyl-prolyl cis-trans isomerase B (cyclophilin B)